jgi:hypothetical protein
MTLDEYCAKHGLRTHPYGNDGARMVFASDLPAGPATSDLWHLTDWFVSAAISGPAYALSPRSPTVAMLMTALDTATREWHDAGQTVINDRSGSIAADLVELRARVDEVRRTGGLGPSPIVDD